MIQVQDNSLTINTQENNFSPYNDKINYQKAMLLLDDNCLDKAWKYIKNIDTDDLKEKMGINNIDHYALNNIKEEIKFDWIIYEGCDGLTHADEVGGGKSNPEPPDDNWGTVCCCICCCLPPLIDACFGTDILGFIVNSIIKLSTGGYLCGNRCFCNCT